MCYSKQSFLLNFFEMCGSKAVDILFECSQYGDSWRRVVHFWGCPLSPFRGMPPAKILRGCRFPKWLPKWLFDSKEGGIEREGGRPDINFAHARGKLVGTESRRMKLEPDRDRRRRRRRRRPRNEMQIWRLLGRGGRKKEKVRGKRSGGGTREA